MPARPTAPGPRARAALVGGVLVGTQLLGKHTGVVFVACGLFAVAADRTERADRRERIRAALIGVAAGVLLMLGCVVIWGSLRGFLFLTFDFRPCIETPWWAATR